MSPETQPAPPEDLATRLFGKTWFGLIWVTSLAIILTKFWWIRDAVLVWWVYGRDAYFRDGLRVLPGKPIRFSNGERAPTGPDALTGMVYFFVVALGLTLLLFFAIRFFDRLRSSRKTA